MRISRFTPLLALLALPLAAAAQPSGHPGSKVQATRLLAGNERGVVRRGHEIVRSRQQLQDLMKQVKNGGVSRTTPNVDFTSHVVVYYALPTKVRRNDRVYIRSGRLAGGVLHLQVVIAKPASVCRGTRSLISPYAVASLPLPAADIRRAVFHVTRKTFPCQ